MFASQRVLENKDLIGEITSFLTTAVKSENGVILSPFLSLLYTFRCARKLLHDIASVLETPLICFSNKKDYVNSISMVQWSISVGCDFRPRDILCYHTAAGGFTGVLKWARSQDPPYEWSERVNHVAAQHGNLETIKYLFTSKPPCPINQETYFTAAEYGQVHILQWLHSLEPPHRNSRTKGTIQPTTKENLHTWSRFNCRELSQRWEEEILCRAAGTGQLETLHFLRGLDPPVPWNQGTCDRAAEKGQICSLQWLRSQDPPCPIGAGTCAAAADSGYFNVVRWLRGQEPPCPWDGRVSAAIVRYGDFEVLKEFRGFLDPLPIHVSIYSFFGDSKDGGNIDILNFLLNEGIPVLIPHLTSYLKIIQNCKLEVIQWFRDNNYRDFPWTTEVCDVAARQGRVELLNWLRCQSPPCPWDRESILEKSSEEVRRWVLENS